jgi:hypothetical protein
LTACVFHLFYNAPEVCALLPAQAALTCVGNACCALAAYRIAVEGGWSWEGAMRTAEDEGAEKSAGDARSGATRLAAVGGGGAPAARAGSVERAVEVEGVASSAWAALVPQLAFLAKLFAGCVGGVYVVKYGELAAVDLFGEGAALGAAIGCIGVPTLLNVGKWAWRSRAEQLNA